MGNKFNYVHCADSCNLICIETKDIVPVYYPTAIEITNIPGIVKIREQEAIERYERIIYGR